MASVEEVDVEEKRFGFASRVDGMPIAVYAWLPEGRPRGAVVVAHGLGEHALRYAELGVCLRDAGIAAVALDHRGHGRSLGAGGLGSPGAFAGPQAVFAALVADLERLIERVLAELGALPLVLFGHSLGSLIAQEYCIARAEQLAGLVLSGSMLFEAAPREHEDLDRPAGFHAGNLHELADLNAAFAPARTPFDWLSRDAARVDAYLADPLCGIDARFSGSFSLMEQMLGLSDPKRLRDLRRDLPVLLVAGDADPFNRRLDGLRRLEQLWRAAGVEQIDTRYYPGGRHEMLHETNRDAVRRDLVGWIEDRLPRVEHPALSSPPPPG